MIKKTVLFAAILIGSSADLHAEDASIFEFYAQSYSTKTHVHFVLMDPQGRRLGMNPIGGRQFDEIPGAEGGYGTDSIGDDMTGEPGNERAGCTVSPVIQGTYTITLYGTANTRFSLGLLARNAAGQDVGPGPQQLIEGIITAGTTYQFILPYDPISSVPMPVIKQVDFETLRQELMASFNLRQLGDDHFVSNLTRMLDLAEKLSKTCEKHPAKRGCSPAAAVLELFITRLELANKKCEGPSGCDEEREWSSFRGLHGKDTEFKEFFSDWDKDEWHRWKKNCKRFVSDQALSVLKPDAQILIAGMQSEDTHDPHRKKPEKTGKH
ncbi:MAG: hypothetical protein WCU88_01670 [Elusimicrobiota bacterium]